MRKVVMLTIATTILVMVLSLSQFNSTVTTNNNTKVAAPVINLETNVLEVSVNPSEEKIYYFSVSNSQNGKKSEVSMQYTLQVETLNNLPLDFELYAQEDEQEATNLFEGNGTITDNRIINLNEDVHEYKLKIKWNENHKSYLYSQTIEYVNIILNSNQAD